MKKSVQLIALVAVALLSSCSGGEKDKATAEKGVTEELKEKAPMQWVGLMNNIRSQAEEVILTELIYR